MFIVPTQPQTAWQVVRSGFALWQSTFRFVGPFSIGFATINAGHDYYTLSVVDNHSLTPSVFMMGMLSVWIHASIIDAIHRGRGQPIYHYLAWPNSLKFAPYLAIIDDSGIVQSIRNSFAISDKYGWFLSNRLSMIALILFILVLGILLVVLGACFLFSDKSVMNVEEQIKIVTIPVLWFLNAFLYPLLHALMLETLYDLRLRKAGL